MHIKKIMLVIAALFVGTIYPVNPFSTASILPISTDHQQGEHQINNFAPQECKPHLICKYACPIRSKCVTVCLCTAILAMAALFLYIVIKKPSYPAPAPVISTSSQTPAPLIPKQPAEPHPPSRRHH